MERRIFLGLTSAGLTGILSGCYPYHKINVLQEVIFDDYIDLYSGDDFSFYLPEKGEIDLKGKVHLKVVGNYEPGQDLISLIGEDYDMEFFVHNGKLGESNKDYFTFKEKRIDMHGDIYRKGEMVDTSIKTLSKGFKLYKLLSAIPGR